MAAPRPSTWLITGASSGIGKSLALAALRAGFKVIGTTRDVAQAETSFSEFSAGGGIWKQLNPSQNDAFEQFSKCAAENDIDVLVNNAGYAFLGAAEDTSEDEVRDQMEVNFYGPLRAIKACLPSMRAKGSGELVLISSGAGFVARASRSTYASSKFAIEAVHESVAQEVKTLGVKVLIVELGAFRTAFSSRIITPARYSLSNGISDAYKGTAVEQILTATQDMRFMPDSVKGDPDKAAEAIIKAVREGHDFLRMPLGSDCVAALEGKIGALQSDLDATRAIAVTTDID
ncbi:hypothetical protein QQS21_012369 [Conoideocrella luteorostrata]|uniref:Uncharacterized protein n=1 Tax=Conoideocrella luteorostrata TaxID=1105319 RepID=A0AAJ0FMQ3_9HYPO|nr:hypothetical protein QQS21_012369 [Conoideocrella luteorostrata]